MTDAAQPPPAEPDLVPANPRKSRITALIVASALFMQNLDSTVVATALPQMAKSFGADPLHMNVALTSYLLALAAFVPASGWIADRYGTRTVFRGAIVLFTFASVLCGQATSLPALVGARILQGIGGAMMTPVGRLVLLRSVAKSDLVAAMSWLTVPALLGPVIGPPLGGFISTYADWRLIFDINVPLGILGVILVSYFVEDIREPPAGRFDTVGLALSALALASLLSGLETVGRGLVPWPVTAALLAAGVGAAALYLRHARRHPAPLLDLSLLSVPSFALSMVAGTLFRIGVGAIPFLLPLMLQLGFGKTAVESGMITFASSIGAIAMKTVTQRVLRRMGFRNTLIWNGLASSVLLACCALFRPAWPLGLIYGVLLAGGFLRSLQFTAYNTLAYADIPRARMSAATSLYATVQQLSLTVGITLGAAVLGISTHLSGRARPGLIDFSFSFLVVALLAAVATPVAARLRPDVGAEMSGHRPSKVE